MIGAPGEVPAFLVVRLSSFGDVVLAEPVAREIKRAFGPCRVVFATYRQYAGLPSLMSSVDQVLAVEPGDGARCSEDLPETVFDTVVDLQNNFRSRGFIRSLPRGAGARRVVRYRRQYVRRLLCVYAPWVWRGNLRHTVDLYLDTLRPMGARPPLVAPRLTVPSGLASGLHTTVGGGALIAVCPGASSTHKTWGRGRFTELTRRLKRLGYKVLVIGSEGDRCEVEGVVEGALAGAEEHGSGCGVSTHVTDDVAAIAGLLSICRATVSNDSGLMHLAAAVGSKAVGIFGPTSPMLGFAPLGPGCRVVTRNARCSPCSYHGNRPCRLASPLCMEEICPSEVASIVDDVAGGAGRR